MASGMRGMTSVWTKANGWSTRIAVTGCAKKRVSDSFSFSTQAASEHVILPPNCNQAEGLAKYAQDFLLGNGGKPTDRVLKRTNLFFTDAMLCGTSALALRTNAPTVLRKEALKYESGDGVPVFGSSTKVHPEKAILANCAATREWDSNGTNFGYNPALGHVAGEFGHPDFFPVAVAAAQQTGKDGKYALLCMTLLEEIRCRLGEVFSLKSYKIDHVVHGAIASAVVYGTSVGATVQQIESAIGMVVAHYVPFRAIRAGKQLSDSKGSSSAISTEVAILAVRRAMDGFEGPKDIFRNPESIFRLFEGPGQMLAKVGGGKPNLSDDYASPFLLSLGMTGEDFAVLGEHFKLGLYEHQSAGAMQGLLNLLHGNPQLMSNNADGNAIQNIEITAYEPAFGIIGDPAKKDPRTRQSADHSMAYIIATALRKALETNTSGWKELMLSPYDYSAGALHHPVTRSLMSKINFKHGGPEYDSKYPDGIPTSLSIATVDGNQYDSGLIMYPAGHARNTEADLEDILAYKFDMLSKLTFKEEERAAIIGKFSDLQNQSIGDVASMYDFEIAYRNDFEEPQDN